MESNSLKSSDGIKRHVCETPASTTFLSFWAAVDAIEPILHAHPDVADSALLFLLAKRLEK